VDNKFISTSDTQKIPTEIIDNQFIVHYKYLRNNSSRKDQTDIFNCLPNHLEVLEIYYNNANFLIEFFLTSNLNLPMNLKRFVLDFKEKWGSPASYVCTDTQELIDKLYAKIKIPFGCELLININI
jgi:hypothetical protein